MFGYGKRADRMDRFKSKFSGGHICLSFNTIAGLAATQTPTNQDCGTCLPNLIDGCMESPNGSSRQMRHQPYERFDSFYEGPSCQHQLALGFSRWERPDD